MANPVNLQRQFNFKGVNFLQNVLANGIVGVFGPNAQSHVAMQLKVELEIAQGIQMLSIHALENPPKSKFVLKIPVQVIP